MKVFIRTREWAHRRFIHAGEIARVEIQFGAQPGVVRWRLRNGRQQIVFDMTPEAALGEAIELSKQEKLT